ncbi:hypothetical protein ACLOJK_011399 [Asimina triloba]
MDLEATAEKNLNRLVSQPAIEAAAQKSLERVVSQKALQMSSSFPCKICVAGFLLGVCFTYIFVAVLTSSRTVELGFVFSSQAPAQSQNSNLADSVSNGSVPKEIVERVEIERGTDEERASLLYSAWSAKLDGSNDGMKEFLNQPNVPDAPHLENCELRSQINQQLDNRGENGSPPLWSIWKGALGVSLVTNKEQLDLEQDDALLEGVYHPPWIVGSDEDNFPLTRRVQHDIWIHQHPPNCSDPQVRFLVADWERLPGFGMGAQLAGMCGLLAIAVNEQRVLVTNYYNRADHDDCQGSSRSQWSCYFFPETSSECQDRAFELMTKQEAWEKGIVTSKENYTSKQTWTGQIPRIWGSPWSHLQPTTEIDGTLLTHHRKMDRRWWRAQAIRYLMRFPSQYTCGLLNIARHSAFGLQAAKMVLRSLDPRWPELQYNEVARQPQADIERLVWSNHKPWIPRPLLSMHVRMGDKASEMKVVGFAEYMQLAERIQMRFPDLNNLWLSTEMQFGYLQK